MTEADIDTSTMEGKMLRIAISIIQGLHKEKTRDEIIRLLERVVIEFEGI
jgi:hypothetical protein